MRWAKMILIHSDTKHIYVLIVGWLIEYHPENIPQSIGTSTRSRIRSLEDTCDGIQLTSLNYLSEDSSRVLNHHRVVRYLRIGKRQVDISRPDGTLNTRSRSYELSKLDVKNYEFFAIPSERLQSLLLIQWQKYYYKKNSPRVSQISFSPLDLRRLLSPVMMFTAMTVNIVTQVIKSVQSRKIRGSEKGWFGLGLFWIGSALSISWGYYVLSTSSIQLLSFIPIESTEPLILISGLFTIGLMTNSNSREESESNDNEEGSNDTCRGVIYTRVSSAAQAAEGNSLENQAETLREVAEDMDIEVVGPIVDDGETGKNWDRKGIKILKHMAATQEISHLLIDDIDRLGRSAIETLYFIWRLRSDYEITIITQSGRELDASNITDLMTLSMKSIMADLETDNQSRRSNSARRKQIEKERDWLSWFKEVPLGYQLRSDGWIQPDPDELEAVEALFSKFLDAEVTGAYSRTAEYLNENHGEVLDGEISSQKVKRLLKRPLYVGVPTPTLKGEDIPIEDENLQLTTEQMRNEALEKIDEIYRRNSSDGHNADGIEDLVDRFGAFEVYNASSKLIQLCDECGSSSLTRSGTTPIDNSSRRSQQYRCKECGSTQALPTKDELDEMRRFRDKFRDGEEDDEE